MHFSVTGPTSQSRLLPDGFDLLITCLGRWHVGALLFIGIGTLRIDHRWRYNDFFNQISKASSMLRNLQTTPLPRRSQDMRSRSPPLRRFMSRWSGCAKIDHLVHQALHQQSIKRCDLEVAQLAGLSIWFIRESLHLGDNGMRNGSHSVAVRCLVNR